MRHNGLHSPEIQGRCRKQQHMNQQRSGERKPKPFGSRPPNPQRSSFITVIAQASSSPGTQPSTAGTVTPESLTFPSSIAARPSANQRTAWG